MRYFILLLLIGGLLPIVSAQNRQETIDQFNVLKSQAKILEQKILSPDKKDSEIALRDNISVFRILPREIYDNGLFSTRGGGAYYSFYFRIPDYGHGSDVSFEQNYLQTAISDCGLMTDLGEIPLGEITKETSAAISLINYQNAKDLNLCRKDYYSAAIEGLKLDETIFKPRLPAAIGHTYLVRSVNYDYYDILVAFQVRRKDTDGSLVIFWKQLEQFETPHRNASEKTRPSDDKILAAVRSWKRPDMFPNLQSEVENGVVTLRGRISKDKIAYAVQLANGAGATKVINLISIE